MHNLQEAKANTMGWDKTNPIVYEVTISRQLDLKIFGFKFPIPCSIPFQCSIS